MNAPDSVPTKSAIADPITFAVFKSAVIALADEMGLVMMRTAHSMVAQSQDLATAICDEKGRVVAQGNNVLAHLGAVGQSVAIVLQKFKDKIYEGDVFIFNEEELAGQHLPDIFMIRPCFWEARLVGFTVCMSHHIDLGGKVPGSQAPDSTEIYQEGLQIPIVKLYVRGEVDETLKAMLLQNVRQPDLMWGDFEGQMSACYVGEVGLRSLVQKHGLNGFRALADELFAYTERLTRKKIAQIPDGAYEFTDWLDDDFVGGGPVRLHVSVQVIGDRVVIDWAGSGPQVKSAINHHFLNTYAVSLGALLGAFGGDIPSNDGFYRAITVTAPPGTIVHALRPAARGARGITSSRMMDTILGALAKAVPDGVPAAGEGGVCPIHFAGTDASGQSFYTRGISGYGSWGARPGLDGSRA